MNNLTSLFKVQNPGMLTLLQDGGRYGAFNNGLTNGGPLDNTAFYWANRLCHNQPNDAMLEVSLGGLTLIACIDSIIALTGADMPLTINGHAKALWQSHFVKAGDVIELGYAVHGLRSYLAVYGGFSVTNEVLGDCFGSSATVCRENIGGLHGDGSKLVAGDMLMCSTDKLAHQNREHDNKAIKSIVRLKLPCKQQPQYHDAIVLRTILSYQQQHFSALQQRLFFSSEYQVSANCDRMGYRLTGKAIKSKINGILSEGICHGAVQIPSDGQPIVLLNDRQTIGGYPKIGSVIAFDTAKLAQAKQGSSVRFEAISMEEAHNLFHLNRSLLMRTELIECS
ncbi:biotin-dependent carboxyltransferase family protein [Colwellia asteriadis]|uniref:Biotin-dependent carboxyltransferase family protein n=1 Tax=Colwellia asteriadis TaxID=517723 RepID=A0ABN1LAJ1_9GAMM